MRPRLPFPTALVLALSMVLPGIVAAAPTLEKYWELPPLTEARGLTRDSQDQIYAVDGLGHRILKYGADGDSLGTFGTEGSGYGQLLSPTAIASNGTNLYVADQGNNRIQMLTANGSFLATWGDSGSANGQFVYLIDVEVAPGGDVYALDGPYPGHPGTADYRVQRFTSGGAFVLKWGGNGSGTGQFNYAGGIAIDSDGNVYVADSGNNRVQKFTAEGTYLAQFLAANPSGIDVDASGNVYVIDRLNWRVQQFTSAGAIVTTWGTKGPDPGQFEQPWDVTTSSDGNIFVSDNHPSIQRFGYATPVLPTTWGALKSRYLR